MKRDTAVFGNSISFVFHELIPKSRKNARASNVHSIGLKSGKAKFLRKVYYFDSCYSLDYIT